MVSIFEHTNWSWYKVFKKIFIQSFGIGIGYFLNDYMRMWMDEIRHPMVGTHIPIKKKGAKSKKKNIYIYILPYYF
jgi:hypothetical protein